MAGPIIYYDGDCPFCAHYVRYTRVSDAAGKPRLVNVREHAEERKRLEARGLNLDKGMVVEIDGQLHSGARAMHMLTLMSTPSSLFNRLVSRLFRSPLLASLLYPLLRAGRAAALLMLGRTGLDTGEGLRKSPHGLFFFLFGAFGVVHFIIYTFRFPAESYPSTWAIGFFGLLLAYKPLSRRLFLALLAALAIDGFLQAPMYSNHTILKNFFVAGVLLVGLQAWFQGENWATFVRRFAVVGQLLLLVMYVFGIFHKINSDFLNPEVSCAVDLWRVMPLPEMLREAAFFHWAGIYGTFVVEALIIVLLLVPRWRYLGIAAGIGFHIMLGLSAYAMYPAFSTLTIALHCLFLPPWAHTQLPRHPGLWTAIRWLGSPRGLVVVLPLLALLLYFAWLRDYGAYALVWLPFILAFGLVVLLVGRDDKVRDAATPMQRDATLLAGLVGVLFFLNCLTPYFGLKTAQSMNMFANLRLEGGQSNHLVFRNPPGPFGYLADTVEIVDPGRIGKLRYIRNADLRIVYYSLLDEMERHPHAGPVTFIRNGHTVTATPAEMKEAFEAHLHPRWFRKWFHFSVVDTASPKPCASDR